MPYPPTHEPTKSKVKKVINSKKIRPKQNKNTSKKGGSKPRGTAVLNIATHEPT